MEIEPIKRISTVDWIFIPILLMAVIVAYLKVRETAALRYVFTSFFNFSIVASSRDEKKTNTKATIFLTTNSIVGVSVLIYLMNLEAPVSISMEILLIYGVGIFLSWFILKRALMSFIGFITETNLVFLDAKKIGLYYYQILGVLLLPGLVFGLLLPTNLLVLNDEIPYYFSNIGLFYCLFIVSIMYIIKLLQAIRQSKGLKISWYYIIFYLCTLEILPLIVLYALLVGDLSVFN